MSTLESIYALVRPLKRRVDLMVSRCVLRVVNDALKVQGVQVGLLAGETRGNLERMQEYGFTSRPHPGAEGLAVFVGGGRDHGVVVACEDRRYRLRGLASGEVALYTDEGDYIHFKRGKVVEMSTETFRVNAGTKVEINTPLVDVNTQTFDVAASVQASLAAPAVDMGGGGAQATLTGSLHITGPVTTASSVTSSGDHVAAGISLATHVHVENDGGGPTDPPTAGA